MENVLLTKNLFIMEKFAIIEPKYAWGNLLIEELEGSSNVLFKIDRQLPNEKKQINSLVLHAYIDGVKHPKSFIVCATTVEKQGLNDGERPLSFLADVKDKKLQNQRPPA